MTEPLAIGGVHHLRLAVADVDRARAFYVGVLGFEVAVEIPPGVILSSGRILPGSAPDPTRAANDDRFDPNRVGLDHLSFAVDERADLELAIRLFDERGIPHGEITDLGPGFGIHVLTVRDPDDVQLEPSAPYGEGAGR